MMSTVGLIFERLICSQLACLSRIVSHTSKLPFTVNCAPATIYKYIYRDPEVNNHLKIDTLKCDEKSVKIS